MSEDLRRLEDDVREIRQALIGVRGSTGDDGIIARVRALETLVAAEGGISDRVREQSYALFGREGKTGLVGLHQRLFWLVVGLAFTVAGSILAALINGAIT